MYPPHYPPRSVEGTTTRVIFTVWFWVIVGTVLLIGIPTVMCCIVPLVWSGFSEPTTP